MLSHIAASLSAFSSWLNTLQSGLSKEVVAALITVIGAVVVFLLGRTYQRYSLFEAASRSELSINIETTARAVRTNPSFGPDLCVETVVRIKNIAKRTCCVLAAYTWAEPMSTRSRFGHRRGRTDWESVPIVSSLGVVQDLARIEGSILQLAPDEEEYLVRWDFISEQCVSCAPLWRFNVDVYAAEQDLLGEKHFGRYRRGRYRQRWIGFMDSAEASRHSYVIFGRWNPSDGSALKPFQRFLRTSDLAIDLQNTKLFKKVLKTVVRWNRETLIDLQAHDRGQGGIMK